MHVRDLDSTQVDIINLVLFSNFTLARYANDLARYANDLAHLTTYT